MEKRKVPTIRNTRLKEWVELVKDECKRLNVDFGSTNELQCKQAWEFGHTPVSWVDVLKRRAEIKLQRSEIFDDRNLFKDYVR